MIHGADIRRYRKLLGMNQIAFARHLGVAQPTLSHVEGGRTAVSQEHVELLLAKFDGPAFKPTFRQFLDAVEAEAAGEQAALIPPQSRHSLVPVWEWEDGFDLSRQPEPGRAVDMLTLHGSDRPAIAFRMTRKSDWWDAGDMFIFEPTVREHVKDGDVCLLQHRIGRSRGTKTVIAVAHLAKRGRMLQFEPIAPPGPVFTADDAVSAILRAVFRGRRLDE